MTSIKVLFIDGTSQLFSSASGMTLVYEQYWLQLNDNEGRPVAAVPRERIQSVTTGLNA